MIINATFDTTITSNGQSAAMQTAINEIVALYESLFINDITVDVLFRFSPNALGNIPLGLDRGAVNQSSLYNLPYHDYINALQANSTSPNDFIAMSGFQASPLPIINRGVMAIHSANGRAVGLNTPALNFAGVGVFDGVITVNSTFSWSFTRPTSSNRLDFKGAVEHELDELLGLGSNITSAPTIELQPQDLFAWTAFAGGYDIVTGVNNIISGNAALTFVGGNAPIDLPFPVTLFNQQYTQATVVVDGQVVLKSGNFWGAADFPLPVTNAGFDNEAVLFPYWAGFNPSGVGDGTFTGISGTLGSRKFVIEWRTHYADPDISDSGIHFEVVLDEDDSNINFIYDDPTSGILGTIGLQTSGIIFNQFSFNDPYDNPTRVFNNPKFEVIFVPSDFISGVRNLAITGRRYFALDGSQRLVNYNQTLVGDAGDWEILDCPQSPYYVQGNLCFGQSADISGTSPEGITLDIIGYAPPGFPPAIPIFVLTKNITSDAFTTNWYAQTTTHGYELDIASDSLFTSFVTNGQGITFQNFDIGNVTGYDIRALNHDTTYYYRLRSYNDFGLSDYSNSGILRTFPTQDNAVDFRNIKVGTTRGGSELFSFDPLETFIDNLLTWTVRSGDVTMTPDPNFTKQVIPASAYSVGATGYINATGAIYYNTPQFDDVLWVGSDTLGLVNGYQYNSIGGLVTFLNNHTSHHMSATQAGGIIHLTSLLSGNAGNALILRVDGENLGNMGVSNPTLIGGQSFGIGTPVVPTANFTGYFDSNVSGTGIYSQELTGIVSGITILPFNKTFTGTWNLQTGRFSFVDYRQSGFFNADQDTYIYESGRITSKLDNFLINIPYTSVGTGIDIVNLFVSGYHTNYSVNKSITGVR